MITLNYKTIVLSCVYLVISPFSYGQPASFISVKSDQVSTKIATEISTNNTDLCQVAKNTLHYLNRYSDDSFAVHAGNVFNNQITLMQVKNTLQFICTIYQQDQQNNRTSRLNNRNFLLNNFDFIHWQPDTNTAKKIAVKSTNKAKTRMLNAIPKDKLFLTKYYTKLLSASTERTKQYSQALYAIPYDEQLLSLADIDKFSVNDRNKLNRFSFTRQQIIAGALLNNKLAKALVWLTEEALHDVLLQGTGVLNVEGETRYFNVHRNNGIAYNYSIGKREQARYWYFIETPEIMGYGKTQASKIAIKPHVSLAGNIAQLGLGKLVMLNYSTINNSTEQKKQVTRLAILADQGGAFDDNLFQLDLLVDSYKGWQDYHQANKHIPDYADVWLLIRK